MSVFAIVVAAIALLIAMLAYDKAAETERAGQKPRRPHRPPAGNTVTDADRRRMAVERRQHENFMSYDGKPQDPIDETTILEE